MTTHNTTAAAAVARALARSGATMDNKRHMLGSPATIEHGDGGSAHAKAVSTGPGGGDAQPLMRGLGYGLRQLPGK